MAEQLCGMCHQAIKIGDALFGAMTGYSAGEQVRQRADSPILTTCVSCSDPLVVSAITCGKCCAKTPSVAAHAATLTTNDLLACIALNKIADFDAPWAHAMFEIVLASLASKFSLPLPFSPASSKEGE